MPADGPRRRSFNGQPREVIMAELSIRFAEDERKYLVELLQTILKERRIEEHRTRTPSYREHVLTEEKLVESLLNKLQQPLG
jgi:hypothetical protein